MAKIANLRTRPPHVKGVSLVHSNTVSLHSSNTQLFPLLIIWRPALTRQPCQMWFHWLPILNCISLTPCAHNFLLLIQDNIFILLLESPCSSVRPLVGWSRFLPHLRHNILWCVRSHSWVCQMAWRSTRWPTRWPTRWLTRWPTTTMHGGRHSSWQGGRRGEVAN